MRVFLPTSHPEIAACHNEARLLHAQSERDMLVEVPAFWRDNRCVDAHRTRG
jgi:hypothetical protein